MHIDIANTVNYRIYRIVYITTFSLGDLKQKLQPIMLVHLTQRKTNLQSWLKYLLDQNFLGCLLNINVFLF